MTSANASRDSAPLSRAFGQLPNAGNALRRRARGGASAIYVPQRVGGTSNECDCARGTHCGRIASGGVAYSTLREAEPNQSQGVSLWDSATRSFAKPARVLRSEERRAHRTLSAAGAFRAETAPIVVRGLTFSHALLTPKNMGVILTATGEMLTRSSLDLAAYFQNEIVKDTAEALDAHFVSDSAASAIAPAGARSALTAADTRASSGASAPDIVSDIKIMVKALTDARMGAPATTKWIMNPLNLVALSVLLTASGAQQFPEADGGRLAGFPVLTSITMDPTIVLLIDFSQFAFAMGNFAFEPTSMATLHEESETPLPIGSAGTPAVVAAPVRSLYQTYSWAVKMVLDADWVKLRPIGPVQQLTAVAW